MLYFSVVSHFVEQARPANVLTAVCFVSPRLLRDTRLRARQLHYDLIKSIFVQLCCLCCCYRFAPAPRSGCSSLIPVFSICSLNSEDSLCCCVVAVSGMLTSFLIPSQISIFFFVFCFFIAIQETFS